MTNASVANMIPTFSHTFLSSTTIPSTTISPNAFNAFAQPVCPLIRTQVNENLQNARDARRTGDFSSAIFHYNEVIGRLREPTTKAPSMPLASLGSKEKECLSEAIFGVTALSKEEVFGTDTVAGTKPATENLAMLIHHIEELELVGKPGESRLDIARAKILQAFNLMQYTGSGEVSHDSLYRQVEEIAGKAIEDLDPKEKGIERAIEEAEVHFLGKLLIAEALARRMELAHSGRDPDAIEKLADRIKDNFETIYHTHIKKEDKAASPVGEDESNVELFARYEADAAILKFKLGLGYQAFRRVRSIVSPGTLDHTAAARMLRGHEYFKNFFDSGGRFYQAREVENIVAAGAFWRRARAAFAYAHSPGLGQSLIAGAMGMITGVAGAALTGHPEWGWAAGGIGGSAVEGAYQLYNGWNTREARAAKIVGTRSIPPRETSRDIGAFLAKRLASGLMWSVPAAAAAVGPDLVETVGNTIANIPSGYAEAFSSLVDNPENLFPPLINGDPWHTTYQLYTKAAGALFLTNLLANFYFKRLIKPTRYVALAFLPGAFMLSADIGITIVPPEVSADLFDAWVDRIWRASIVSLEMLGMMLITGLASLEKTDSFGNKLKSLVKTFIPIKGTANYNLPLAAAIVTGISSPLGGMFQVGEMSESIPLFESIPLMAARGATITAGLLGLTLGVSGILKQQIPFLANIGRGIRDVKAVRAGEAARIAKSEEVDDRTSVFRYPYEALRGAGAAFNGSYMRGKISRIPGPDVLGSLARLFFGDGVWDCNEGQAAMSATNGVFGNPYWDSTYPPASGTQLEQQSFVEVIEKVMEKREKIERKIDEDRKSGLIVDEEEAKKKRGEAIGIVHDFLRKAGQAIHPLHFFLPHNSIADRLWPLYSLSKPLFTPKFPQRPNPFLYESVYHVIADRVENGTSEEQFKADPERLSTEQFEVFLEYIKKYAADTGAYHILRSMVKTLLLARKGARFGGRIERFFKENPEIPILLTIDPEREELKTYEGGFSRIAGARVRDAVAQPFSTYEDRIRRYRRNGNGKLPHNLEGMFQTSISSGSVP